MKSEETPLTMDEAVAKIAALTEETWSRFSPQEQTERLRKVTEFISSVTEKER
jgi:hypothetical protein